MQTVQDTGTDVAKSSDAHDCRNGVLKKPRLSGFKNLESPNFRFFLNLLCN